jgi:hypothetical protein
VLIFQSYGVLPLGLFEQLEVDDNFEKIRKESYGNSASLFKIADALLTIPLILLLCFDQIV